MLRTKEVRGLTGGKGGSMSEELHTESRETVLAFDTHTHTHTRHVSAVFGSLTAFALLNDVDQLPRLQADLCRLLLLVAGHHHVLLQEHGVGGVQTWGRREKTCCQPAASHRSARATAGHPLCHRPRCL